jgi:uncharacterized protein
MLDQGVYFFTIREKSFAYDTNTTACVELDNLALTLLPEMLSGRQAGLKDKYAHLCRPSQLQTCLQDCRDLLASRRFATGPRPYRHRLGHALRAVCLHISHDCNLNCQYCYADAGSFGRERVMMNDAVMIQAIDFALHHAVSDAPLDIGFFGGEPLLNFKLIRRGTEYAKAKAEKLHKAVTFSMTSNATRLTRKVMEFISREGFSLIFSLDGPKEIHDRMRKYRSRKGSHAQVLRNLKLYQQQYSDRFTVRGTFTGTTPNFSEQVLFLNDQGFKSVSVEPAQLAQDHPHAISSNASLIRVQQEYDKLADLYLERFDQGRPLHFFHFDYALTKLLKPQPMHTQCGAGAGFIAITPDGRIFPCFETVVEEENCLGHIASGFDLSKRKRFQRMHVDLKKACRKCCIKYFCGGGCHAFNIRYNSNITKPYVIYCELTKYRFKLAAWILSEIVGKGAEATEKLRDYLMI